MKRLPLDDPGEPDNRSAARYLLWVLRNQLPTILPGVAPRHRLDGLPGPRPGRARRRRRRPHRARPDRPARRRRRSARRRHRQAVSGIMRHRFAVTNWLGAAYRTVQLTARQATRLGATLPKRVATGEVVAIGTTDCRHIGDAMDVTRPGRRRRRRVRRRRGDPAARPRSPLGLVVLLGVPLLLPPSSACCSGRCTAASRAQRELQGAAHRPGRRHRRRPAGAARHRRRGGLPRPLPRRVAAGPRAPASASPGSQSLLDARAGPAARRLRRPRDLARRPVRRRRARSPPASWSPSTATPRSW